MIKEEIHICKVRVYSKRETAQEEGQMKERYEIKICT